MEKKKKNPSVNLAAPPKKSALNQNFKDPSPGDTKVHIKFHRVLPTPPRSRRSERLRKWEGEVETLSVPRGRDPAALEKSIKSCCGRERFPRQ